jgi:hypothetical protein
VVDDYGDAVAYERRCFSCMRWGAPYERGACRECSVFLERQRRASASAAARKALNERRRLERLERIARDPTERDRERQRERVSRAARLEADAERERALARARAKRYVERLREDPERNEQRLESMRIDSGLRRMRLGLPTGSGANRRLNGTEPRFVRRSVASAPLADAVARVAATLDEDPATGERMIAERAGLSPRLLLQWRRQTRPRTLWDSADRVLVALGLMWWEVFDPEVCDPEVVEEARRLWGDV